MIALVLALSAHAADLQHSLVWDLSVGGSVVGTRKLTIKYVPDDQGTRRILESFTDIDGQVGPIRARFRQRMTAHIGPREPASFHSVVEENGRLMEIQGRWTPSAWMLTTTADRRSRTVDLPLNRVDLSTADLMDPYSMVSLGRLGTEARILSAESGDVQQGPLKPLGVEELSIDKVPVQVSGYEWTSPQGKNTYWYSPDGFLVKYQTQLLGVTLDAVLQDPPPGGVDDFPVAAGSAAIEQVDL
jgi:hypothetical protein